MTRRSSDPIDGLALLIASGAGSGYSPVAPGTAGSLAAIPLYLLMARLDATTYLTLLVLILALAVWAADHTAKRLGREDPGLVVIDEVVGMLTTMALAPAGRTLFEVAGVPVTSALVLGFLLFRFFDILKPFGVGRLERLHGGLGIVMDDYWAGVLANLCLRLYFWMAAGPAAGATGSVQ
jgi:phosphatidylglycerophosphatase A